MPWAYRTAFKLFVFAIPIYVYIGLRLSTAIQQATENTRFRIPKGKSRLVYFISMGLIYIWPLILLYYMARGNLSGFFVFSPQLQWQDYLFQFPAWWGLILMAELLPLYLTLDLYGIIFLPKRKIDAGKIRTRKKIAILKIGLFLFFAFYIGVKTCLDTTRLRIDTDVIVIPGMAEPLNGLRINLFGDIHMSRYTVPEDLDLLNSLLQSNREDMNFFSGDLTSRGRHFLPKALNLIADPKATIGNIACMGDHDYWTAAELIPTALYRRGWSFLHNKHRLYTYNGARILVTGITYVYSQRIDRRELNHLLSTAPKADLKILLVHQPRQFIAETAADHKYHLMLAGHTHGGEVVPHVMGIPYSPGLIETPYCWGIHQLKGLRIIITNGIGRTLAKLRYHAPSQIQRLILKNSE